MLALAGTTATPALLASAVFAATAAGKVAMEGAELWNQGVHSEYTLRFAPHVDAPLSHRERTACTSSRSKAIDRNERTVPVRHRQAM